MSIAKTEKAILVCGSTLLGIFIYQFCLLNFNQAFSSFELKWILGATVLIQLAVGAIGILSLLSWIYFEITHLSTMHHWRIK